jgi:hypothetical protein
MTTPHTLMAGGALEWVVKMTNGRIDEWERERYNHHASRRCIPSLQRNNQ